jgi:hypothetical protein
MDSKFDWNDITIVPEILSIISSRSEIDIFRDGKFYSSTNGHGDRCQ